MIATKKFAPIAALLLFVVAALVIGASRIEGIQVPAGGIVTSPNAGANDSPPRPDAQSAPQLPAAQGQVLASDDFSKEELAWESLSSAPASWLSQKGHLQQNGDLYNEPVDQPAVLIRKGVTFSDGLLEAYVYPTGGDPVGVVFRGSDAGYYRLSLSPKGKGAAPRVVLEKMSGDSNKVIATAPVSVWAGYTLEKWQLISISARGSGISVSVDGRKVLEATDASYGSGWVGVWSFANLGAQFDNVRIQQTAVSR